MVLILDKTDRRPHKSVVLGRVGGSLWGSIWEGVKKIAPYALPVAAPLALSWLFGKKDQQQQPQQQLPLPNIDDVYELGKSKVKQAIPPQMMEMFEMYKELSKKKKKVIDEEDDDEDEVDGSGVSKRTKRKLKNIVRGSGIRMFR